MGDTDASRYWRIAQADLQEARRMWELSGFRASSIGFLLQQAAEKGLKSWIDLLQELGEDPSAFGELADLTFFAVQSRYDDELAIDEPDWPAWINLVTGLLSYVERR